MSLITYPFLGGGLRALCLKASTRPLTYIAEGQKTPLLENYYLHSLHGAVFIKS